MATLLLRLGLASHQAPPALAAFRENAPCRRLSQPWVAAAPRERCARCRQASRRRRRLIRLEALAEAGPAEAGQQPYACPSYDIIGLGQAMVDVAAVVDDSFLAQLRIGKGQRRVISLQERGEVLEALVGNSYQVSAGGSLSNTLVALARLGRAEDELRASGALRVGMAAVAGSDPQGAFHRAQLASAGVCLLADPLPDSTTGTVTVLTTGDADRTFLSYLGDGQALTLTPALEAALGACRMLVVEGYLWEMPGAAASVAAAIAAARSGGAGIALTAGDPGLVARHREDLWGALREGVDVFFANREEASTLLGRGVSAEEAALALGPHCGLVAVTDGARGSCLSAMGRLQVVPPFWAQEQPMDTCGAGDAYAAGLLYARLSGLDPAGMGAAAARAASTAIARRGAAISASDAREVVAAVADRPVRGRSRAAAWVLPLGGVAEARVQV